MADRSHLTLSDVHKDAILRTLHDRSERRAAAERMVAASSSPTFPHGPGHMVARHSRAIRDAEYRERERNRDRAKLRPARDVIRDRDRMAELMASTMAPRNDKDKRRRIAEWAEDVALGREWTPPLDIKALSIHAETDPPRVPPKSPAPIHAARAAVVQPPPLPSPTKQSVARHRRGLGGFLFFGDPRTEARREDK